jgi:hypothetical protein
MVELAILFWYLVILCVGCLVADYIFPHIGFIQRYVDSLPMMEDDCDCEDELDDICKEEDIA